MKKKIARTRNRQQIHLYDQPPIRINHTLTVEDMRTIGYFNRLIKNYMKINKIKNRQSC